MICRVRFFIGLNESFRVWHIMLYPIAPRTIPYGISCYTVWHHVPPNYTHLTIYNELYLSIIGQSERIKLSFVNIDIKGKLVYNVI